jgi:hypothetical protein
VVVLDLMGLKLIDLVHVKLHTSTRRVDLRAGAGEKPLKPALRCAA